MPPKELRLECPACRARLVADVRTAKVLSWQPARSGSPRAKEREGDDAWYRAQRRVSDRHDRGEDRFEAALAKERLRAGDLDARYDEVEAAEPDPFEAALSRVRDRDARLAGVPSDAPDDAAGRSAAPASRTGVDFPAPFSDDWIRRLSHGERAALVARTRALGAWEHADTAWGAHEFGALVVALGPGYGDAFGIEAASEGELDHALALAAAHPPTAARLLPTADHAAHAERLLARDWRPDDLDAVFWRDLALPIERQLRGASVRRALPGDLESWRRTLVRALELPLDDEQRRPERLAHEFGEEGWRLFLSSDDGEDVAAAALFLDGDVAVMGMAATLPEHRGRGHQKALVAARLEAAVEAGARVAISLPEMRGPSQSATQANGFSLAYHQTLWVPRATGG